MATMTPSSLAFWDAILEDDADVFLNTTLMETFGGGIYSAIFWFTLYMIVFRKRATGERLAISQLIAIVPLYVLIMVHLSISWAMCRRSFIVNASAVMEPGGFFTQPQSYIALSAVTFNVMILIEDLIMIWRLWAVWNCNWKISLVPILVFAVGAGFAILDIMAQADPDGVHEYGKFGHLVAISSPAYLYCSLACNVTCTSLIVSRIIYAMQNIGFNPRGPYRKVIEILIESSALYSIPLIFLLPYYAHGPNKFDSGDTSGYPETILVCVTAAHVLRVKCKAVVLINENRELPPPS